MKTKQEIIEEVCLSFAREIQEVMPSTLGFVFVIYERTDPDHMAMMASGTRQDAGRLMRDWSATFDAAAKS